MKPEHKRILTGFTVFLCGVTTGFLTMAGIAVHDLDRLAAAAHVRIDACEKRFERGTLLYEFTETAGLELGPFNVKPAVHGKPIGQLAPAWYIPAEVRPTYYGRPGQGFYFLTDVKTGAIVSSQLEPQRVLLTGAEK
jgi:hypothetical protein